LDSYTTALAACAPEVRNKAATATKNAARDALKLVAEQTASLVNGTASVTDAMKVEAGIPPRAAPTRNPVPGFAPMLGVKSVRGWTVKIELIDAATGKRARPPFTSGASVFSHVGETAPVDVNQWTFEGNCGRTTVDVVFDSSLPAGTKVWLCAFWFNGRKQSGPACAPVSTNLQAGSVSMAA
jgi:hypothetical protein